MGSTVLILLAVVAGLLLLRLAFKTIVGLLRLLLLLALGGLALAWALRFGQPGGAGLPAPPPAPPASTP